MTVPGTNSPFQIPSVSTPTNPALIDLLNLFGKQLLLNLACHHVGTIQSFDAAHQTAQVTINYKKTVLEFNQAQQRNVPVLLDYPILLDVPVMFLKGGQAGLSFPVKQGDQCWLEFNDRDFDNWFAGLPNGQPATGRLHSFSDAFAIVGISSLATVIQAFDTERAVLYNGTTMVGVGPNLVKVANNLYTLNQLLQELVTDVKNLVSATAAITVPVTTAPGTSGPPLNAASINAVATQLTATANKIQDLLE